MKIFNGKSDTKLGFDNLHIINKILLEVVQVTAVAYTVYAMEESPGSTGQYVRHLRIP